MSHDIAKERMRKALTAKPLSAEELSAISGLHQATVRRWLSTMKGLKALHVSGYGLDNRGRPMVVMFKWGQGVDAPRPGPRPGGGAERMRLSRERRRAAG